MRAWSLLGALSILGCNKAPSTTAPLAAAEPAPSASAAPAGQVRIDRSLLDQGRVRTLRIEARRIDQPLTYPGELVADEAGRAEAGSLVSGRVASLEVDAGATVRKGQALAWVDAPEVGRASAELIRARARAEVAQRKAARQKELEGQQATSKNAVDEAQAEARVAQADLAAARGLLASLGGAAPSEEALERASGLRGRIAIRSPIDGLVAERRAVLGGAVTPDQALFTIVAAGHAVALVRLPEGLATGSLLQARASLSPRLPGPDAPAPCGARVQGDLGVVDPATRTRSLRVVPDGPCAWLRPGGFVSVTLDPQAPEAARAGAPDPRPIGLLLPREALTELRGDAVVFVAEGDGYVARGIRSRTGPGDSVIVEAGLRAGETVVVSGALLLKGELLRAEFGE
jgi:cobalt-zinc-cadmium efflux system membrane fusion protein